MKEMIGLLFNYKFYFLKDYFSLMLKYHKSHMEWHCEGFVPGSGPGEWHELFSCLLQQPVHALLIQVH